MKIIFLLALSTLLIFPSCSTDEPTGEKNNESDYPLVINEFMASNDAAVSDAEDTGSGDGSPYDDWFEIYNPGADAVDLAGMYVTDNMDNLKMYMIPEGNPAQTTIPAGGFLVIWADNEPDQGPRHAAFALSGGGEAIALVESNGLIIIDSYAYGTQQTDFSYGRNPDGGETWQTFSLSTPGASNNGGSNNLPPVISDIIVSPDPVDPGVTVTVSAEISDDNLSTVQLTYGPAGAVNNQVTMTLSGAAYTAQIGPFADGNVIYFFITATDDESAQSASDTLFFEVGYVPPVLYINEFLASNNSILQDPDDDGSGDASPYDDWIEIYNPGGEAVDVAGMYVTDKLSTPALWQIPDTDHEKTTIPAGGFIIIWADKEMQQGVLHVDLKLSGSGEQIGLFAPNGTTVIDSLTYTGQVSDVSFGRQPDGSSNWTSFATPTPGATNN